MPPRNTKTAAIAVEPRSDGRARAIAKRDGLELVVKGADGAIEQRDSFGNDPRDRRG